MLSVVIPAHNEEGCIESTLRPLSAHLRAQKLAHEILVVNDNSSDQTPAILAKLSLEMPELRVLHNQPPSGFGFAVRCGLEAIRGDAVAVYMADASDRPEDLVRFFQVLGEKKVDCVFGTRFHRNAKVVDYPWFKLALNRVVNNVIRVLFGIRYNDVTNAFKMYRSSVIPGLKPFLSPH